MKNKSVTDTKQEEGQAKLRWRRCCFIAIGVFLFFLLLSFIVALVLALTVFKRRDPITQLVSATLDGVSPRITFPVIRVQLNITLNLVVLLKNRNHVAFRHGVGKSILVYRGHQVGEADMPPGMIPAMKSTTVSSKLTLQMEKIVAYMGDIVSDVLAGKIVMASRTVIPGRITIFKIIKKHVLTTSECQFDIGFPSLKIQNQECKYKTQF